MRKLALSKGQKFVDKSGKVWQILKDPVEGDNKVSVLSITLNQELTVPRTTIKNEWKKLNY